MRRPLVEKQESTPRDIAHALVGDRPVTTAAVIQETFEPAGGAQGKRSSVRSSGAPAAALSLGSGGAVNARGCLHCGDESFESPQVHQEVGKHSRGFRTSKISRRYGE
jgi:hypothetical protein